MTLSVGTMSAVENQKASLDIDTLLSLCTTLNVPLEDLLPKSPTRHFHIARRSQIYAEPSLPLKVVNRSTGRSVSYHNRLWPLAKPFVGKHLEPFEIEVQPIGESSLQFIAHNHEEFVFVLDGRIECRLVTPNGLQSVTISAGDCIYFWSYLPHCIRSAGQDPARTIHVEYSQQGVADAEYGQAGAVETIYLVGAGNESLAARIAGKVVALRRARGMTHQDFADQIGISTRRLKQIESAKRPISLELLLKVCSTFQKPKEYFLADSFVQPPFWYALRSTAIRRRLVKSPMNGGCFRGGSSTNLADGFPTRGMQPTLVRLERSPATKMIRHPGQEFVYVLRGNVRFRTRLDDTEIDEHLSPGDACFVDSSIPHSFSETSVTPYGTSGAELLAVHWTPHVDSERKDGRGIERRVNGRVPSLKRSIA